MSARVVWKCSPSHVKDSEAALDLPVRWAAEELNLSMGICR
jgi:hypothetical protein